MGSQVSTILGDANLGERPPFSESSIWQVFERRTEESLKQGGDGFWDAFKDAFNMMTEGEDRGKKTLAIPPNKTNELLIRIMNPYFGCSLDDPNVMMVDISHVDVGMKQVAFNQFRRSHHGDVPVINVSRALGIFPVRVVGAEPEGIVKTSGVKVDYNNWLRGEGHYGDPPFPVVDLISEDGASTRFPERSQDGLGLFLNRAHAAFDVLDAALREGIDDPFKIIEFEPEI